MIALDKAHGWEWNTKVPGAFWHPEKRKWTHVLETVCLEIQWDEAVKQIKVLRDALEHWMKYECADYPTTDSERESQGEDFTNVFFDTQDALAMPNLSHLTVLSLEELKKWPCGCRANQNDGGNIYHIEDGDWVKGKCPRCLCIEQMEKDSK